MENKKDLVPAEELLIVELDDRYEFSAVPLQVGNDACNNTNDCRNSTNTNGCTNSGTCFR